MSNCSSARATAAENDDVRRLSRILHGIAGEFSAMGTEIARIGDALSDSISNSAEHVVQLQAFDRLAQNAHSQARLIAHLARSILVGEHSASDVLGQIAEIPIPDVRRRLLHALEDSPPAHAADLEEDPVFWTAEPPELCAGAMGP